MHPHPAAVGPELTDSLRVACRELAALPNLLVCSDFDGTLAPIVPLPSDARPASDGVDALLRLAGLPATTVAVVSGRSLRDLAELSGLPPQVHLVGSHGAELGDDPDRTLDASTTARLVALTDAVRGAAQGIPGVLLEPKPAGVAVHVRRAARADAATLLAALRSGPGRWAGVFATEGHEVLELSVVDADKGHAVDVLRARSGADGVLYVGDDLTDESAFARLSFPDVGVKVGPGPTVAAYRVAGPPQVVALLALLVRERTGRLPR